MKNKIFFLILICVLFVLMYSCHASSSDSSCASDGCHPKWSYSATIYEMNIRQLTQEGTFKAAEEVLPMLRENGIDILWIMPCQPIGIITRKGSLGSYYSIRDYQAINPEFGTMDDFRHFLATAHQLGFKVILDWVANHTAPDHPWVNNPDWHVRDKDGNLVIQYDWTDIAKLNYNNADMRTAMKNTMLWWMDSIGIDGFRCDVAGEVPTDFWNDAIPAIRKKHPDMFTLAEDEDKANELTEQAFDMYYGWTLHKLMNEVAQGKATVSDLWEYFKKVDTTLRSTAIRMNFTSNHDENSWNGTEMERLGNATDLFAAFTYIIPGMPLIYTGQLCGNHHRLAFFEKDVIDCDSTLDKTTLYAKLNAFRKANKALRSNPQGGQLTRLSADNQSIFACSRTVGNNTIIAIFNMSDKENTVTFNTSACIGDYITIDNTHCSVPSNLTLTLAPWEYIIMAK